jgi:SAUR family protein
MGFQLPAIRRSSSSKAADGVAKGYLAVYVGDIMKRFVIPVSFLNQPSFISRIIKPVRRRVSI